MRIASHTMGAAMRNFTAFASAVLLIGVTACSRHTAEVRHEPEQRREDDNKAARVAGRAAYQLSQEAKKAAVAAGHELRTAGKGIREGWSDAKQESKEKRAREQDRK